jgi:hypothetical protein
MPTRKRKKEIKKGLSFPEPNFSSGVHNLCRSDAMVLMMLTRGRLLCCFARPFLCPIGAPSYTERRKDGASDVVCVVVVAGA